VPFPTVVIATMLGVEADERDAFRQWSELMVRGVFEPTTTIEQRDIARAGEEMGAWLDRVIADREGTDSDDLISVLLRATNEDRALTHDEARVFVSTLLVAGSFTTAYLIGNAATALLADPDLLAWVSESPNVISGVVEESLRHDTPVQMMFRTATGDVEIAGFLIPAGATVVALLGSANRDPRVFADPDRFDATRGATEHVSFGYGVHFCLGAALARLEATVALQELVARASRLEPAGAIERTSSLVFRGPARLPLRYR
jgi:cytochrome P450